MELSGHEVRATQRGHGRSKAHDQISRKRGSKYRVLIKSSKISGTGRTLNIGSGGVLFTTEEKLPLGRHGGAFGELAGAGLAAHVR